MRVKSPLFDYNHNIRYCRYDIDEIFDSKFSQAIRTSRT